MKTDHELAELIANDIIHAMNFESEGEGLDKDGLLNLLEIYMKPGECPCAANYNDNYCTPGVWIYFDEGCRYYTDYPGFDEALKEKLPEFKFKDPAESENEDDDPDAPYTVGDCILIYEALDDIFTEAKEIIKKKIYKNPKTYFAPAIEK